jgi:hypothetical protein
MHELILPDMKSDQRIFMDPMPDGTYIEVIRRRGFWKVAFGKRWPDTDRHRNLDSRRYENCDDALQAVFDRHHNTAATRPGRSRPMGEPALAMGYSLAAIYPACGTSAARCPLGSANTPATERPGR